MKLTDQNVYYIAGIFDALFLLYYVPTFSKVMSEWINGEFPKESYIQNELTIKESGKVHPYFLESKRPDIFNKWIIEKQLIKVQLHLNCGFMTLVLVVVQLMISALIILIVPFKETGLDLKTPFIFLIVADYIIALGVVIAVMATYFNNLKNELLAIRYNTNYGDRYNSHYSTYKTWFEMPPKKIITTDEDVEMIRNLKTKLAVMHLHKKRTDEENNNN